jgi:molecular chaperone DnaK (HSP70)
VASRAQPRAGKATVAWTVGIDLGTTHTVVACAQAGSRAGDPIRLFPIPQLAAPGEVAARPLLPSLRYHPAEGELAPGADALPWPAEAGADGAVIGLLARRLGAAVPGRLVASAKSWLSHAAVDRLADILPWGAAAGVPQVSPVTASASYLAHVRAAWNHAHPAQPLQAQELVLTVPASFDDTARALTLEAARAAGLPQLRLLEEPQAALYDWLFRHRGRLAEALGDAKLVLVCDVGGGTTDLSLVTVGRDDADAPIFERVAVGRHLMLGGDNMDLALAHLAEGRLAAGSAAPRLSAGALAQLVERCRAAKEVLLAADAPASVAVTLLGRGASLIGGARSTDLTRDEVQRIVVDGFFPQGAADEGPRRARGSGLVAFGLPYASDAAVTRHIAAFLQQHAGVGWPDALLLNGGVFRAAAITARLQATLDGWRGAPLRRLHNADPDVAVARGAVAYALARRGRAPRIGGGSPRSYFLLLGGAGGADSEGQRGVCLLPHGSEEGREIRLTGRQFALRVGEPVRFRVAATTADRAPPRAGDVVDLAGLDLQPLPPIATVLRGAATAATAGRRAGGEITVQLAATLTEVGTLELHCVAEDDASQRWQLEFQLRADVAAPGAAPIALPARLADALQALAQVFGTRDARVEAQAVKQLRKRLEALLGQRESWPTAVLRPLFDALLQGARGRRRSADHERLWLSLAGWCLRPGFGDALDAWRIEQLWPLYVQGVQHGHEAQVNAEWWTLWRRVAGGLDQAQQQTLLDGFALNLRGSEADIRSHAPRLVKGSRDDMVRLGASLERVEAAHKVEVGDWLVAQLAPATGMAGTSALWTTWAIGRLGARVPLYGSAHGVVPAESATVWLEALLVLDWKRIDGAAAAAASLARLSGDRARDLPPTLRERVIARLMAHRAPPVWVERLREVVALDEAGQRSAFGEALPPGLTLIG